MPMNLIVGSTGMVGMEICRLLAAAGKPIKALVRANSDPTKVDALEALGATVVRGDLRDPRSLKTACQGVSAVITTASAMPFAYNPADNTPETTDRDAYVNLIAIARDARVQQFIYTSFPPLPATFPLQDAKRAVEKELWASGLNYTILQPTYFTEIWLSPAVGFDYPNRKATIYGTGVNAISWISFLDVAQFAAASVGNAAARNATFELGGPRGISPLDVVRIFEQASRTPFEVTHVPVEALQQQLSSASDPLQKSFAGLMIGYASSGPIDMGGLRNTYSLKLQTVEDYASRVMSEPAGV
jgi:NADH dehydrogenase